MKTNIKVEFPVLSIVIAFLTMLLGGCGGGASSSLTTGSAGSGTAGVLITDGPAVDYDEIWIQLREVSLIPVNEGSPVIVWQAGDADGQWMAQPSL